MFLTNEKVKGSYYHGGLKMEKNAMNIYWEKKIIIVHYSTSELHCQKNIAELFYTFFPFLNS